MSTFSGLGTALSALYAQRRGMDVTSQNIANANTDGYSRQRAELRAAAGTMQAAMHARADPAGNGVTVESVTRLRDTFLEARGRIERGNNQYIGAQQQIYGAIEQIVGEPSDTGLQAQLNEFWSGWEDLASRPGDEAVRTQLLRRGGAVAATLSNMHSQLSTLWDVSREQAGALTIEINSNARQVAELNDAVVKAHHVGMPFHEFADQRDRLVQRLSELTGAVAVERKDGSVDVTIAGSSLVNGGRFRQLRDAGGTQLANPAVVVQLEWTDTPGVPTAIPSGRLGGMLEALNGTLPATAARLDDVANTLATTVNGAHDDGFDLAGAAGADFFTGAGAGNVRVAITNPREIAAASTRRANGDGTYSGTFDGANADAIGKLISSPTGADREYRDFVVGLGIAAQTVYRRADTQQSITDDVDAARQAMSGVSLDEEMTNMLAYQRAYQAATKVVSTIDEMLDTLINRMGR